MPPGDKLLALAEADPEAAARLLQKLQSKLVVPHDGGQREILENDARFQIVCCGRRFGKSLRTTSPVLTPSGWTTIGELDVGDYVVGSDGKPTEVEGVFPQGELGSFRVHFNDGSWVDSSEDHLWTVRTRTPEYRRPWKTLTLREIMDRGLDVEKGKGCKFKIPAVKPIEFEEKELPIDPYVLGVLLGDGGLSQSTIKLTSADKEIIDEVESRIGDAELAYDSRYDYRLRNAKGLKDGLADLGLAGKLSWEKHIPEKYLYASISQREELLQGLMDTDGWAETPNQVALSSSSEQLRDDVRELMRGLGGRPISWKKKTTHRDAYLVQGSLPVGIQPFKLKRKLERYKPTPMTFDRSIVKIEPRGKAHMTCIQVSNPDGLFVTKDYIVTHNTVVGAKKALLRARKERQMIWWVAPTYKVVKRGYREVLRQLPDDVLTHQPPQDSAFDAGRSVILKFKNGSRIEFYSAERPEGMLGEGVDLAILDEAATMPRGVWETIVRPTLMDRQGSGLMISTPRGRNWFYYLWLRGQDEEQVNYASWKFPTSSNPYILEEEVADMKAELPLVIFEQEVLADFISSAGAVFRYNTDIIVDQQKPKGHVVVGIDLAKSHDFTVFSAANIDDAMPCGYDRFVDVAWALQKKRIHNFVKRLEREGASHVTLVMDSTGVGDPIVEEIEADGYDVVPINFTKHKQNMVTQLSKDLEDGIVRLDKQEQIHEYENYAYTITPTGKFQYGAPEGQHDDVVSAKMLQWWGVVQEGAPNVIAINVRDEEKEPQEAEDDDDFSYLVDEEEQDTGLPVVEEFTPDASIDIMRRPGAWQRA